MFRTVHGVQIYSRYPDHCTGDEECRVYGKKPFCAAIQGHARQEARGWQSQEAKTRPLRKPGE